MTPYGEYRRWQAILAALKGVLARPGEGRNPEAAAREAIAVGTAVVDAMNAAEVDGVEWTTPDAAAEVLAADRTGS